MELGVDYGGSVSAALNWFPSLEKMVLFDFFPNGYGHIAELLAKKDFPADRVTFCQGDVKDEVPRYFQSHPSEILDVVLVDADHNEESTLRDIFAVASHSCMIVVDDLRNVDYPHMKGTIAKAFESLRHDFWFVDDGLNAAMFIRRATFGITP
jgi:hypothetical protein